MESVCRSRIVVVNGAVLVVGPRELVNLRIMDTAALLASMRALGHVLARGMIQMSQ